MEEQKKYNGFKLLSLDIRENPLLSTIFYDFIENDDKQNHIYSTVLIGPNGTGKSNLFRVIIDLFNELYWLKQNKKVYNVVGRYILTYASDGYIYKYTNIKNLELKEDKDHIKNKKISYFLKNDKEVDFEQIVLPSVIIANSIMVTDKYPFYRSAFPIYKYLGIKSSAQNASTRSYVRKTVELIVAQLNSDVFKKGLQNITEYLGVENTLEIFYETSNTSIFFTGELTPETFKDYFYIIQRNYSDDLKSAPFKLGHYLQIESDENTINDICNFCNKLVTGGKLRKTERSSIKHIYYDILNEESFQLLKKDFKTLEILRRLGLINPPEINLKKESHYSLKDSSSGEYHFLSSMVGLIATVNENSLIFIDEPEISLHPNWQMKYLDILRLLFKKFSSSHLFIATHSHFLISDLKSQDSKIIGLKNENHKIEIVKLPQNINTYGWSAEEILHIIFGVKTTRNHYLQIELTELLGLISENSKDKQRINTLLTSLKSLNISDMDPLNEIISEVEEYIKDI